MTEDAVPPTTGDPLFRAGFYASELFGLFLKHKLPDALVQRTKEVLLEDPFTEKSQYLLKEGINNVSALIQVLGPLLGDYPALQSEIKNVLCPSDDLQLPVRLKRIFANNEPVAFFVGAGLSSLLGLPLWKELSSAALRLMQEMSIISPLQYDSIRSEVADPRQQMSIFHELMKQFPDKLNEFYREQFTVKDADRMKLDINPYDSIAKIGKCIKVTTNLDCEFRDALQRIYDKPSSVQVHEESSTRDETPFPRRKAGICYVQSAVQKKEKLEEDQIYHLHGCIEGDPQNYVLTFQQYIDAYYVLDNPIPIFLKELFLNYTVVFVGFGLQEFVILERVLTSKLAGGREHFALQGIYSTELPFFRLNGKSLTAFNITPIPYYRDGSGYKRLCEVLAAWSSQIEEARDRSGFYKKARVIDEALEVGGGENES